MYWTYRLVLLLVFLAVLIAGESVVRAGADCEPQQGWKLLETLANGKTSASSLGPGNNDVDLCLLGPRSLAPWQKHWYRKGPKAAKADLGADARRLKKLCLPAMSANNRKLAKELCVVLLAADGVGEIAGKQTLAIGNEIFACGFPLKHIAGLRGSDSARAAEAQWNQDYNTYCGYGGCSCNRAPKLSAKKRKKRRRAKFLQEHKLDILNALSYVGDADSITWIQNVAAKDDDPKVQERAAKVLSVMQPSL